MSEQEGAKMRSALGYKRDYEKEGFNVKTLKKYGVSLDMMAQMQVAIDEGVYKVVCDYKKYYKNEAGKWTLDKNECRTEEIGARNYMCIVDAIPIFDDKVEYTYTKYGKIPCKLSCISWGTGNEKAVRKITFTSMP